MSSGMVSVKLPVTISIVALAAMIAQAVAAEGGREIHMRFAGDFIRNIEQTHVDAFGQPMAKGSVDLVRARPLATWARPTLRRSRNRNHCLNPFPMSDARMVFLRLRISPITTWYSNSRTCRCYSVTATAWSASISPMARYLPGLKGRGWEARAGSAVPLASFRFASTKCSRSVRKPG